MRILAIDGALNHSGWALLEDKGGEGWEGVKASKYGIITTKPTMSLGFKLSYIRSELIKLIASTRASIVVIEETYSGKNALTNARLNNAKGVIMQTVHEVLGADPITVTATVARRCLGFKNNKEEPYAYFQKKYKLPESFEKGNDITDAYTVGWWYILSHRNGCVSTKKKTTRSKKKK
jgi:Holliday junction resolvasome RuvABC endonuclease subunit